ncbi:MAG: hypothetical protein ACI8RD_000962 [Bacillariaceae sp.]|jgi:hypothetical protein
MSDIDRTRNGYDGIDIEQPAPPPPMRVKRRGVSKKYTKPIFKEPGSKIPQKNNKNSSNNNNNINNEITEHNNKHYIIRRNRESKQRSRIVAKLFGEDQSQDNFPSIAEDGAEKAIQPSSYNKARLEQIVGKPIERHGFDAAAAIDRTDNNSSITLGTRLVQKMREVKQPARARRSQDFDCGSSVVTVSDLDNLEAKTLRRRNKTPPFEPARSDLSLLHREINVIISSILDERDSEPSERSENLNHHQDSGRLELVLVGDTANKKSITEEENECSDGFAPLQSCIDDFKAYWRV